MNKLSLLASRREKLFPSAATVKVSRSEPQPSGNSVNISSSMSLIFVSLTRHSPRILLPGGTAFVCQDPSNGIVSSMVTNVFKWMIQCVGVVVMVKNETFASANLRRAQFTPMSTRIGSQIWLLDLSSFQRPTHLGL